MGSGGRGAKPGVVPVVVEQGVRRAFASALDWPGWSRSGRDEAAALDALDACGPRYAAVAGAAGVSFRQPVRFEVVERLPGNATTDFGAPGAIATKEREPATSAEAARLAKLVAASWAVLDGVVAGARVELRKGPRGGGRDRDRIVGHVAEAEDAYARKLGIRQRAADPANAEAVAVRRAAILAVLGAPSPGDPLVEKGWPVRYAARRIAWHALDHAWEIEDRSQPPPR